MVTTLPSGNWMGSKVSSSSKRNGEMTEANSYLVIFSDDGRTGASNQSRLGKLVVICCVVGVLVGLDNKKYGHERVIYLCFTTVTYCYVYYMY